MMKLTKRVLRQVDGRLRDGASYREIADELGVPLQTLYARIRSAGYRSARGLEPVSAEPLNSKEVAA